MFSFIIFIYITREPTPAISESARTNTKERRRKEEREMKTGEGDIRKPSGEQEESEEYYEKE